MSKLPPDDGFVSSLMLKAEDTEGALRVSTSDAQSELALKNRPILVVTPDSKKIEALNDILRSEGYVVFDVNSGEAAVERFDEFTPDLVLLDVDLPGVRAFETCRALCSRLGRTAPAVIFIASKSDPAEVVEGLAAGGVDYLPLPFRAKEVLARLRVHLLNRLRLAQLNREDKAKNRLICMAAHDLRNPLVSIRALTNVLRAGTTGAVNEVQRDLLDTVYDASQSMLDLVNELLDVSLLEAGVMKLVPRPASLDEVLAASVKLNNATAAQKGSFIVLESGPRLPVVSIDEPKIRQVLNNLLSNAIKFSPSGSTITVTTDLMPKCCAIAIRDQGPGIPESERARLFKEFSRTSVAPTGGESSIGLGLAICHRIIQAHSGTIRAQNAPGGGAEFRITLPIDS